jgi:hypothetical protein
MNTLLWPVAALTVAMMAWVPLWVVAAKDPYAMPVTLGLFAIAGSFVGGAIALAGLVRLALRVVRRA